MTSRMRVRSGQLARRWMMLGDVGVDGGVALGVGKASKAPS